MNKPKSKPRKKAAPDLSYIAEELRELAVPIDSLELDPENARQHPDNNRAATRASLASRGQVLPITVRLANSRVMTGNSTVEEARGLGWTHIAAIFLDYSEEQAAARREPGRAWVGRRRSGHATRSRANSATW